MGEPRRRVNGKAKKVTTLFRPVNKTLYGNPPDPEYIYFLLCFVSCTLNIDCPRPIRLYYANVHNPKT